MPAPMSRTPNTDGAIHRPGRRPCRGGAGGKGAAGAGRSMGISYQGVTGSNGLSDSDSAAVVSSTAGSVTVAVAAVAVGGGLGLLAGEPPLVLDAGVALLAEPQDAEADGQQSDGEHQVVVEERQLVEHDHPGDAQQGEAA